MCMYLYAFFCKKFITPIIFSKVSTAPKELQVHWLRESEPLRSGRVSSVLPDMQQGEGGLQVWVLLSNKHRCSASWKPINPQDWKNPSPGNAPVLDGKHIFFPPSQHFQKEQPTLSVQGKRTEAWSKIKEINKAQHASWENRLFQ